jgi:DNA-binding MarR family transcriptional regulator
MTTPRRWRSALSPLLRGLAGMDQAILDLYRERGLSPYRSNWSPVLLSLADQPGLSIKQLAALHGVKHASMSQRVASMVTAGLLATSEGDDARTRVVSLTPAGRRTLEFAHREWEATEAAIAALDEETGHLLVAAGEALAAALERRSFADRLRDQLA